MSHDAYHAGPKPGKQVTGKKGETQLFLLRFWLEEGPQPVEADGAPGNPSAEGTHKWHGKVQHVVRGEAHAFTGWEMLIGQLEAMLLGNRPNQASAMAIDTEGRQQTQVTEADRGSKGTIC